MCIYWTFLISLKKKKQKQKKEDQVGASLQNIGTLQKLIVIVLIFFIAENSFLNLIFN